MINKIKLLLKKIENDYDEYSNLWLNKPKKTILDNSYNIAIVQNFYDGLSSFIDDYLQDDSCSFALSEFALNRLLEWSGNLLEKLHDVWTDFRHPERYDFWYSWYDGLTEIIEIIAKEGL